MTTISSINNAFVPIYAFQSKEKPSDGKITKEWLQSEYSKRVTEDKEPSWIQKRSFIEIAGTVLGLGGIFAGIASFAKESKIGKWISGIVSLGGIGAVLIGLLNAVELNGSDSINSNQTKTTEATSSANKPKQITAESFYSRLDYSDIGPSRGIDDKGKMYAKALAKAANERGIDIINETATSLKTFFDDLMTRRLNKEPSDYGKSESWALWDIGKQLYMLENPSDSNENYRLADPLTDSTIQDEIVYRMIGWEVTIADKESYPLDRYPSYELVKIGMRAID